MVPAAAAARSTATCRVRDEPADRYAYDPADPVPTIGGVNSVLTMTQGARDADHARARSTSACSRRRDDVLVYTSEPLERDLEVIGPVEMVLYAASSAKDTDFIVRLCDVHPDGRSIFVTEGILRARYRNSNEGDSTELLEPDEVAEYRIRCYPAANVFKQGHRVRLDVTSSSFPRFSRNLNNGEDVGTATRMVVARADGAAHRRVPVARAAARHPGMNDLFDLTGRTALVTGSTRGLGLALARALAGAGARVAINGRTPRDVRGRGRRDRRRVRGAVRRHGRGGDLGRRRCRGRDRRAREQRGHADAASARAVLARGVAADAWT